MLTPNIEYWRTEIFKSLYFIMINYKLRYTHYSSPNVKCIINNPHGTLRLKFESFSLAYLEVSLTVKVSPRCWCLLTGLCRFGCGL